MIKTNKITDKPDKKYSQNNKTVKSFVESQIYLHKNISKETFSIQFIAVNRMLAISCLINQE